MTNTTFGALVAGSADMLHTDESRTTEVGFSRNSAPLGVATLDNSTGAVLSAISFEVTTPGGMK